MLDSPIATQLQVWPRSGSYDSLERDLPEACREGSREREVQGSGNEEC